MKPIRNILYITTLFGFGILSSCEKNLDVKPDPAKGLQPEEAIKSAADMQKLLNSCYDASANMMNGQVQVLADLLADDVARPTNNENFNAIYNRNSDQFNGVIDQAYAQPYFTVYRVNLMQQYYSQIEISDMEKQRMQGEAAFLRALSHFETIKLWAQPAGYTADNSHPGIIERREAKNEVILRSSVASNYSFIISDLQNAIALLPVSNGIYANKNAAKALLAKVYFTMGNYTDALPLLDEVISGGYTLSDSLNRFKRADAEREIIFGFVTTNSAYDIAVRSASFRGTYRSDLNKPGISISKELYTLLDADTNDLRRNFVNVLDAGTSSEQYASTKFNIDNFATPYLTLTDILLMRAEIHAIQGNTTPAINDLLPIIRRAYKAGSPKEVSVLALTGTALLDEVRLQRRLEMHLEGDRLFQVKRIGVSKGKGNLMVRNVPWDCNGMILQFPSSSGTVKGFVFNPTTTCN
jgi:starch-binding outer membrane protein, SusD/RagB family